MFTVTYYKLGARWFLDYPEYIEKGGSEEDLEPIGGFVDLLELASAGNNIVYFQVDCKPFEGADAADLIGSSGGDTGGYFRIHQFEGSPADIELWVNRTIYAQFERLPEHLYFRKVTLQN
ncbi:DUF6717 family protein [Paraflavisolibacter sp. H34]|uniref:DUF6717 family protein n=1 Tax=Huijunlia imazamoxiresistens TaxID=3127457 RepID=UPI0030188F16